MLEQVYAQYKEDPAFDGLRSTGNKFVPGYGPTHPRIMLVGEAPGSLENALQKPFMGRAGKLLDDLLEAIGVDPETVFITNAVKYWPVDDLGKTRQPNDIELAASKKYLLQEIDIVKPIVVGLCGFSAIRAVFPGIQDVNSVHGTLIAGKYVPLYHPAAMGYRPLMSGKIKKGYKMLNEYLTQKAG